MKVAIVDLGCGNVGSVAQAVERIGLQPLVTRNAREIAIANRVILPGVGAAGFAMQQILQFGLFPVLTGLTQPALGICLGMHLLFEHSEEGDTECLEIIRGKVRKLEASDQHPVPCMGWSKIDTDPGFEAAAGSYFYFAHSYACDDGAATVARVDHSGKIPAAVRAGNWTGVQFHPERSGIAGARFLEKFLA